MKRAPFLAAVSFVPDLASTDPLYVQLARVLAESIRAGRLTIGARLPSERLYSRQLGVSRTTVTSAYQELKAVGLLRGYVGRGAIVIADDPDRVQAGAIPWPQLASRSAPVSAMRHAAPAACISFGDGWLHSSLIPEAALAACAARVATSAGAMSGAAPLLGLPVLQNALIDMLRANGVKAAPGEVLATGGAQQGLNVVARAMVSPGDTVLCENFTWYGAVRAFRAAGAHVVGLGMDHEGVDPDALEDALLRLRPKLVYLIPSFQCPTGRLLGLPRRRRILEACGRARTPIVESHVYGDIHFGERVPSLKSLDTAGLVIHQGSASKTVSPALRLGWLVASRAALDLLAPAKANLDLSTPSLTQGVLAEFMAGAGYVRHLRQMRDALRARRDTLLAALAEHCPELRLGRPEGGLYLWAELPPALPPLQLEAAAEAAGVAVRSGDAFMANGGSCRHIRLCFAAPAVGEISEGAARLGKVLRSLVHARRVTTAEAACASV